MVIRNFQPSDVPRQLAIYQAAFAGYPWFENLSDDTVQKRWQSDSAQPGFKCLVAIIDDIVVGAVWWNELTKSNLLLERGQAIVDFVTEKYPDRPLIWERETMTDPAYQGRGIASALRVELLSQISRNGQPLMILTRMRDDNFAIIKIAQKVGFSRTGIRLPSSASKDIYHEYWCYHYPGRTD